MFRKTEKVHFVGIGGSGMNGIAEVLRNIGYRVSGSDLKETPVTEYLKNIGCEVAIGHSAKNVVGANVVVISSAVSKDNIEVKTALKLKIPVIPRAEMLAELMRMKYSVAVGGAHGKTNTTSMIAAVLQAGGLDPTVVIGGRLSALGSHARLGKGDFLVAEADESDGSFLLLHPSVAIITNIDREHMNHYKTMDALKDAFVDFMNKVPFYGASILCLDDPGVREIISRAKRRVITYGTMDNCDIFADEIKLKEFSASFTVRGKNLKSARITLRIPGRHSVLNSLAAIATGLELDIPFGAIKSALANCPGADRRFSLRGEERGVMVIDDYGHHPTEVRATLASAREGWRKRIIAVFQPHRYTRTKDLRGEFARAFKDSDELIILPIYPAGESPVRGVTSKNLAKEIKRFGPSSVYYARNFKTAIEYLKKNFRAGDMVITIGAGDVWRVGEEFLKYLKGDGAGTASFLKIAAELKTLKIRCLLNERIAGYTALNAGGACPLMAFPHSELALQTVVKTFFARGVAWRTLGGGSNILAPDEGISDAVINFSDMPKEITIDGNKIIADAVAGLPLAARQAMKSGLSGLEFAAGIPGTVGGAVAMNAGAFGSEMKNAVKKVLALEKNGRKRWLSARAIKFGYRSSRFIGGKEIILKVVMALRPKRKSAIDKTMKEYRRRRMATQPISERSAGCVFKNPPGASAGKIIDDLGLKGLKAGGASVSAVHANYIVSDGARASDILALIKKIKDRVFSERKITLEEEIIIW